MINSFLTKAVLVGAAAFAAFSCSREVDVEVPQEIAGQAGNDVMALGDSVRLVHFIAQQGSTKAQFGTQDGDSWPTLWTTNDSELKLSLNFGSAQTAGVTPSEDFRTATFNATIDFSGTSGPYTYYAVSPSSAAMALSPSREAWKASIPCEQTPTAASADEGAIILASASASYATMDEAEVIDLYFDHLTAYGRMSLDNLTLADGETVSSVELTVTTPIVGDWYWKCELEQGEHTLIDYGASSTLTINTSSTENIWFGCAPVEVGDEALVVDVYTNLGVYEQLTAFPAGCKFTAGQVAMFTVDMDGADFTASGSGGGASTSDPLLQETVYGCYLETGFEWVYNPGTDQVTRSYDQYGFETYTLIKPSTVEELEITGYKRGYVKGDGNISISINWRSGSTTVLSQNYTMKIIKEDGPKVWLSDGTHGVIIKK